MADGKGFLACLAPGVCVRGFKSKAALATKCGGCPHFQRIQGDFTGDVAGRPMRKGPGADVALSDDEVSQVMQLRK